MLHRVALPNRVALDLGSLDDSADPPGDRDRELRERPQPVQPPLRELVAVAEGPGAATPGGVPVGPPSCRSART